MRSIRLFRLCSMGLRAVHSLRSPMIGAIRMSPRLNSFQLMSTETGTEFGHQHAEQAPGGDIPNDDSPMGISHSSEMDNEKELNMDESSITSSGDANDVLGQPNQVEMDEGQETEANDVPTTVFVQGLPYDTDSFALTDFFIGRSGFLEVRLPADRMDSTRNRGFGFILFRSQKHAQLCVDEMDRCMFNGRYLVLKISNKDGSKDSQSNRPTKPVMPFPKPVRPPGGSRSIYVGNLPFTTTPDRLAFCFEPCGNIADIRMITSRDDDSFRGFAYIDYEDTDSADRAVEMNGQLFGNRPMRIDWAKERE